MGRFKMRRLMREAELKSNQAWASDITYIRTKTGRLYLTVALVCQALQMTIGQQQPTAGLILHSDRGESIRQP